MNPVASPFDNPAAFAPFFRDRVAVEGTRAGGRRVAGTFRACVLDQGLDDVIAEDSTGAVRRRIAVTFMIGGDSWPKDGTVPQKGDRVTLDDGTAYRIYVVRRMMGVYSCEAREC